MSITTDRRRFDILLSQLTQLGFNCALDAVPHFSSDCPCRFAAVGQTPVFYVWMTLVSAVSDLGQYHGPTLPQTSVDSEAAAAANRGLPAVSTYCPAL